MLLSIIVIILGLIILYCHDKDEYYKALKILASVFLFIIFTALFLKGCEKEMQYEDLKHAQWKYERENGLPYTSFSGE